MDLQHTYTVEEVLEIVLTLKPEDRKIVLEALLKSLLNKRKYWKRFHLFTKDMKRPTKRWHKAFAFQRLVY